MPQDENVSMEKISNLDFGGDIDSNNFGIQDTQLLAGKDLQNFLFNDPDDVKKVEDEEDEETPPTSTKKTTQKEEEPKEKQTTKEKPDGKDALENILFGKQPEEEGKETTTQEDEGGEEPEENTYKTLSKDLLRLGVFSKNSEDESEESIEIDNPEQFLERFNLEKKKGAVNILDNFLSQFGDDYRKMFDAVFVNGVKPQEYLSSFAKIESFSGMNLEDESNQEMIVRNYYKGLKWDDQKIETRINKLKDYGDLEDEAKTYHEVLLNKEKEKAESIASEKAREREAEKEKEITVRKSYQRILHEKLKAQEVDGIPLTQKDAEETLTYLTDKKYKLASGELLSEFDKDLMELNRPENHELKIKLGLLLKKKLDLTSVKKTTISKKSDQLFSLTAKNAKNNPKEKEIKSFF